MTCRFIASSRVFDGEMARLPDESTILRFRHLLETHGLAVQMLALVNEILTEKGLMLKAGSAVDTTLIAAPSSTKNGSGTRDPEMQSTQKGGNWYFGMKMHVGVDADSGLVHTVIGTAANVHDITVAQALLHGEEMDVYADAGYQVSKSFVRLTRFVGMWQCDRQSAGNWI